MAMAMAMERGRELFARGSYEDAARVYAECAAAGFDAGGSEQDMEAARCYSNLSACRLKLGDVRGAEESARRCVRAQPAWWKAHARLGACYATAGPDGDGDGDGERVARAHACYSEALSLAERARAGAGDGDAERAGDAAASVAVYEREVVCLICRAVAEQAGGEQPGKRPGRLLGGRRRALRAGPKAVRMLLESADDARHPPIRLAAVLQLARLAGSPSHRELFLPAAGAPCPKALGALVAYAGVRREDMDRLCVQRAAKAVAPQSALGALHGAVVGGPYASTHPLACAAVGLKNLLLAARTQASRAAASSFLRQGDAMGALKSMAFRDDTAADRTVLECVGFCYKTIVETLLSAEAVRAAADDPAAAERCVADLLGAGVPEALRRLAEHAEYADLPDHAASLGRLRDQIIRCPFHPDNQIPE